MRFISFIIVIIGLALFFYYYDAKETPMIAPVPTDGKVSSADQDYYENIFNYVMDTVPAEQSYNWQGHTIKGSISGSAAYISKSGSTCRNYSENIIHSQRYELTGIACKRKGSDGWCRLKEGNALTCALEKTPLWPLGSIPGIHVTAPSGKSGTGGGNGGYKSPNVSGPNIQVDPGTAEVPDGAGTGVADTVTGTAGAAAGPAAEGAINLFNDLFR